MLTIEHSIVIRRPIEEVFAFVANMENALKIDPAMLEIKKISPDPPGVGTKYREITKAMGRQSEAIYEVTEYKPFSRVGFKSSSTPFGEPLETYTLESIKEGTRVTSALQLQLKGFIKVIKPLAVLMFKRFGKARLARMKQLLG
jgi:hypothetical protein